MALPVIADVFRCTMIFNTFNSVSPRNVFHVYAPSSTKEEVFSAIDTHATEAMIGPVTGALSWTGVDVLPLDGTSTTLSGGLTDPKAGSSLGNMAPPIAAVLSLHTEQRGPRGRGRLYLGPMGEDDVMNGVMDATVANNAVAGWLAFGTAMFGEANPMVLCVASYTHSDQHTVTSINMDVICGTVRRRQNQIR